MRRVPRDPEPAERRLAFLGNHREAIAAMDFFTAPNITFRVLYCFFIIGHDRRRILHFNVTKSPIAMWIVQQLREAFPFESAPRFLLFDRDGKYEDEVPATVWLMRIRYVRTSFQSPWQNGVAERGIESCSRHRSILSLIGTQNFTLLSRPSPNRLLTAGSRISVRRLDLLWKKTMRREIERVRHLKHKMHPDDVAHFAYGSLVNSRTCPEHTRARPFRITGWVRQWKHCIDTPSGRACALSAASRLGSEYTG